MPKRSKLQEKAEKVLHPLAQWALRCHAASVKLVQAGVGDRVARGRCPGVGGQHSWVVLGMDCYAEDAHIIDPTLWSYVPQVKGIYVGPRLGHVPHGTGSIWDYGCPQPESGKPIALISKKMLSKEAVSFLKMVGPLDAVGWMRLASHAPVEGWPAGEIFEAMMNTPDLKAVVPIDRVGMLTNLNPGGLYLKGGPRPTPEYPMHPALRNL